MSRSNPAVIIRSDDPHAYFMGIYKTQVGGCISTWSSDIIDAYRFESMAAAKRFIHNRMPRTVSPYCRVKRLEVARGYAL